MSLAAFIFVMVVIWAMGVLIVLTALAGIRPDKRYLTRNRGVRILMLLGGSATLIIMFIAGITIAIGLFVIALLDWINRHLSFLRPNRATNH